jgi:hypothetical protein
MPRIPQGRQQQHTPVNGAKIMSTAAAGADRCDVEEDGAIRLSLDADARLFSTHGQSLYDLQSLDCKTLSIE